ncbi:MAG TPA: hypothetical protein VLA93_22940 [Pyrinomonadaceae bacterium]|nr:hypothetical protein [Pyrinomonadaceae bacterium]
MRSQNRTSERPDFGAGNEIVTENVRVSQVIYPAAMLEELKFLQVVDRLAQLFQLGLLTVNRRSTGSSLYRYFKEAPLRLSETERRNLYATTIGASGGAEGAVVNREFNDLWLRFVSRVASFNREREIANDVAETKDLALRRAARELAQNLSLHGGGMALYAAVDLQKQIAFGIKLLSDPDIASAYGARDLWQVVDQVATIDLGGTQNSNRYRTMAVAGATIMSWLAANTAKLQSKNARLPLIKIPRLGTTRARQRELLKIATKPTDADLLNACEQWLSVSGLSDGQIDTFAEPRPEVRSKTAR